jgi:16S rRNA (guanine966-N2)-methyltransferase
VSRGAARADLVEKAPRAASVVQRNAAKVRKAIAREAEITVHRTSVAAYLHAARGPFDLVFVDPPYDLPEAELTAALGLLVPALAPGAVVVVERGSRSPGPTLPAGLSADRSKRYGDTTLWWSTTAPADS